MQFANADESFTIVNRSAVARRFTAGGNASGAGLVIGSGVAIIDVRGLGLSVGAAWLFPRRFHLSGTDQPFHQVRLLPARRAAAVNRERRFEI